MTTATTSYRTTRVLVILATLVAWELTGRLNQTFSFVASTPLRVAGSFLDLIMSGELHKHFLITATEAGAGLICGLLSGTTIGLFFWYSTRWARTFQPFILVLGSVPLFALAPLMILWFGIGWKMKAALALFSVLPVAINLSFRGASAVSDEYLSVIRGLGASRSQILTKVVAPGAATWVLNSLRVSAGLALLGAFMGEFISSESGLGHLILRASGLYNVSRALAAAIGIVILAGIFEATGAFLQNRSDRLVEVLSVPRSVRSHGTKIKKDPSRLR